MVSSLNNPVGGGIPDYNKGFYWPTSTVATAAPVDGLWTSPFLTQGDAPLVYVNEQAIVGVGGERLTGAGFTIPVKQGDLCRWSQGGIRGTRFYPY